MRVEDVPITDEEEEPRHWIVVTEAKIKVTRYYTVSARTAEEAEEKALSGASYTCDEDYDYTISEHVTDVREEGF